MLDLSVAAEQTRLRLPCTVGVGIRRGLEDGPAPPLSAEEVDVLGPHVVARRRLHFALGRAAGRDALGDLGFPGAGHVGIGRGAAGEPLWPRGVVGAISHADETAIAVVGRQTAYAGLGVDIEELGRGISARAMRLVATEAEQAWLAGGPETWRIMLFSAKEAVFKALFPIEGVWLGFADAELTWDGGRALFVARLRKQAAVGHPVDSIVEVHSFLTDRYVLSTTYALAAPAPGGAEDRRSSGLHPR